jgi:hypothetical protein
VFYDVDLYAYPALDGLVFAREEGKRITDDLGPKNKNSIMQDHRLLTASGTVAETAVGRELGPRSGVHAI